MSIKKGLKKEMMMGIRLVFASALLFLVVATAKVYKIDDASCTQCGVCVEECPEGAILVEKIDGKEHHYIDAELCTGCALCVEACPEGSIIPSEKDVK